jgi:hypothetical protein
MPITAKVLLTLTISAKLQQFPNLFMALSLPDPGCDEAAWDKYSVVVQRQH